MKNYSLTGVPFGRIKAEVNRSMLGGKLATCEITEEDPLKLIWKMAHDEEEKQKKGNKI